jgi:hypothetical protein
VLATGPVRTWGITLCDMDVVEIGRQVPLAVCNRIVMAGQDSEAEPCAKLRNAVLLNQSMRPFSRITGKLTVGVFVDEAVIVRAERTGFCVVFAHKCHYK